VKEGRMINLLNRLDGFLAAAEKYLLTVVAGIMTLILMAQVVLRYVFSHPLFWAEEVSVQLLVFMTLIGFSLLLRSRQHITIDIITVVLPEKFRSVLAIILDILGLALIVFFALVSTQWILRPEVRLELSPTTHLPVWYNYTMLPIALYAMAFHQLIGLIHLIKTSSAE
jgi:TRAP-type C4-dicarboxylate transport system permease small subunit